MRLNTTQENSKSSQFPWEKCQNNRAILIKLAKTQNLAWPNAKTTLHKEKPTPSKQIVDLLTAALCRRYQWYLIPLGTCHSRGAFFMCVVRHGRLWAKFWTVQQPIPRKKMCQSHGAILIELAKTQNSLHREKATPRTFHGRWTFFMCVVWDGGLWEKCPHAHLVGRHT